MIDLIQFPVELYNRRHGMYVLIRTDLRVKLFMQDYVMDLFFYYLDQYALLTLLHVVVNIETLQSTKEYKRP